MPTPAINALHACDGLGRKLGFLSLGAATFTFPLEIETAKAMIKLHLEPTLAEGVRARAVRHAQARKNPG